MLFMRHSINTLIFLSLFVLSSKVLAGVDFSMLTKTSSIIPDFQSEEEAIQFGINNKGNSQIAQELRNLINSNIKEIGQLLDYPEELAQASKIELNKQAVILSNKNKLYRKAIGKIGTSGNKHNPGSSFYASAYVI